MPSDTVLLALIAAFPASCAAACGVIIALRNRDAVRDLKASHDAEKSQVRRDRRASDKCERPGPDDAGPVTVEDELADAVDEIGVKGSRQ